MADLGRDISCNLRTVVLPFPGGSTQAVTCVQPTPDMREVSGRAGLIEAIIRRITTYRGTLIDVVIPSTTANYGTDVSQAINDDLDARGLGMLAAGVDAEIRKDERVVRSTTSAQFVGDVLMLNIQVVDGQGPFKLVLAVNQVSVQLLSGGR